MGWPEIVMQSLKDHEVNIIAYVPDVVIWRILSKLENDPYFRVVPAAREEEAMGIIVGAYAAKKRGAVFMQSSGLGNCINALGSMCIPWRIPFPFYISMRGESGEFNPAQMPMGKAVRPILDAMGLAHFTPSVKSISHGGHGSVLLAPPPCRSAPLHHPYGRKTWSVLREFV
jgi:sulfopyruvate decarboxylase alpha subunit